MSANNESPNLDGLAWVFVSHASADLLKVRQIRNFMEEKGAAPILFYLRSLNDPEIFWPIIEREIEARNFFLLCDSESARVSSWVQRERRAVEELSKKRPIRVGRVSLDMDTLDFTSLERVLLNTNVYFVYPSYIDSNLIFRELGAFGYGMSGAVGLSDCGLSRLGDGNQMSDDLMYEMHYGALRGWTLVILDKKMVSNPRVLESLPQPSSEARVIFVLTQQASLEGVARDYVVYESSLEKSLAEAARRMLRGC